MDLNKKIKSFFNGAVTIYEINTFKDKRGNLTKILSKEFKVKDIYISTSKKRVFRGIHYFSSSKTLIKYYFCINGKCKSIFIDLRKNTKTYMKIEQFLFNKNNYIIEAKGKIGHGMISLKNNTQILSISNYKYNPKKEKIINWKKIKFNWPFKNLILSKKDY